MKTIEITERLSGTDQAYCVLKVYTDGVRTEIHTGKRAYIERLARVIIRVDNITVKG